MINWVWLVPSLMVGWVFGAMVVWIILRGDEDGKR